MGETSGHRLIDQGMGQRVPVDVYRSQSFIFAFFGPSLPPRISLSGIVDKVVEIGTNPWGTGLVRIRLPFFVL